MEEKSREQQFKDAMVLHEKYGVSPDRMEEILKIYKPLDEILRDCGVCKATTAYRFASQSIDSLQRHVWFKKVETRIIYLTYSCTKCKTRDTFPEIRLSLERRNTGLVARIFEEKKEEEPPAEYS